MGVRNKERTKEECEEILAELLNPKGSVTHIAKSYPISRSTLYKWRKEYGFSYNRRYEGSQDVVAVRENIVGHFNKPSSNSNINITTNPKSNPNQNFNRNCSGNVNFGDSSRVRGISENSEVCNFVELKVREAVKAVEAAKAGDVVDSRVVNKVSLIFEDLAISIEGKISRTNIFSILKILEDAC